MAQALIPFVIVQVADAPVYDRWRQYHATRVMPEKTTDLSFYALSLKSAKETVRRCFPDATFSDEVQTWHKH
jgi:hypothetical protein